MMAIQALTRRIQGHRSFQENNLNKALNCLRSSLRSHSTHLETRLSTIAIPRDSFKAAIAVQTLSGNKFTSIDLPAGLKTKQQEKGFMIIN